MKRKKILGAFQESMDSRKNKGKNTWELIKSLWQEGTGKWMCFGDLNDTTAESEKYGGTTRSSRQFEWGRQTIDSCGLKDLCFEGYPFTWNNGRV